MTEYSYQKARTVMQRANGLRGIITSRIEVVSKWTRIEDAAIRDMQPDKTAGARKMLDKAIVKLAEARKAFELLELPASNLIGATATAIQCEQCGATVETKGQLYCNECLGFKILPCK